MATKRNQPVDVKKSIPIDFTDEELLKMSKQLGNALREIEELEADMKEKVSSYKNQILAHKTSVTTFKNQINLGYQMVQKDCKLIKNFETQRREYWYDGKIVETEALTERDYQLDLELAEEENKEEAARIEKEEAAKKTAELNEKAALALKEESELSDEQLKEFDLHISNGDIYHKQKRYAEALMCYQSACNLKPNDKAANNKVLKCQNWIDKLNASKNDIEENH